MSQLKIWAVSLLAAAALAGCAHQGEGAATAPVAEVAQAEQAAPLVLLIGLDGLNPPMIDRWEAPNLKALAARGVRAESMYPVMPSVTFVNFYSIATGLYPEHHGMVANYPYDRERNEFFLPATGPQQEYWWQGEPIWVTAEKQGLPASIMFWLGSEVPHDGIRPTRWSPYEHEKPYQERVDEVLAWYDAPEEELPRFGAIYFDRVDTAAHYFGPESDEAREAVAEVDGYVGQLVAGLEARGLRERTTIIVVSDHGMAFVDESRTIDIGEYLDLTQLVVPQFNGPYGGSAQPWIQIYGEDDIIEQTYQALKDVHPNIHVYTRETAPDHYHYDHSTRGPDLFVVGDPGWTVRNANLGGWRPPIPGMHGYDNLDPSMGATFIASGPIFGEGETVAPFENVNVYLMIACALGLDSAQTDGKPEEVERVTGGRCKAAELQAAK